jgi:leucyl aminopeptidase
MKFDIIQTPVSDIDSACAIVGVFEKGELTPSATALDETTGGMISKLIHAGDFVGDAGQSLVLHHVANTHIERLLLIGLGNKEKLTMYTYGKQVQLAFNLLAKMPIARAACYLAEITLPEADEAWRVRCIAEAAVMANYKFDQFKSQKTNNTHLLEDLAIFSHGNMSQAAAQGQAIANGVNLARQLANLPCNICTPTYIAAQAKQLSHDFSMIKVEVLERDDMTKLGMGALLAVAQGSATPPKFIFMQYKGGKADQAPTVLVGKGVTFDTGGISIKPAAGMEEMKFDMAGAASVIGTLRAVAELKLPINVVGLVASAENMPDGNAYRPGDILTSMSGQTIEIVNTDAEGRLLLCDALTYAERFNPAAVIDIATLTGAMVMSLGYALSGVFSTQNHLAHALVEAGKRSNDLAWHMPLVEEYQEAIKSNYADMINASRVAGAITAACFLSRFTKKYHWAHIDCAGTAMPSDNNKASGATGRPVPLLVEYLLHVSTC